MKPTMKLETITPAKAAMWLKKNTHNRKPNTSYIAALASAMKRGEWVLNNAVIAFNQDDELSDGQHRLMAIVQSGVTIQSWVCYGMLNDAFGTIDTQRRRTASQVLETQGYENTVNVTGVVRSVLALREKKRWYSAGDKIYVTNAMVIQEFQRDIEGYQEAVRIARKVRTNLGKAKPAIVPSKISALYYHLINDLGYEKAKVEQFILGAFSIDTNANVTIDTLRKALLRASNDRFEMNEEYKHKIISRAWNAYAKGLDLKQLRNLNNVELSF